MSEYSFTYTTFPIDERGAAEALGLDYEEVLADRKLAGEERSGLHGSQRREMREALDTLERETQRTVIGPL